MTCDGLLHRLCDEDGWLIGFDCTAIRDGRYAWPRCWTKWREVGEGDWLLWQRCDECYLADRRAKWRRRHGQGERLAGAQLAR